MGHSAEDDWGAHRTQARSSATRARGYVGMPGLTNLADRAVAVQITKTLATAVAARAPVVRERVDGSVRLAAVATPSVVGGGGSGVGVAAVAVVVGAGARADVKVPVRGRGGIAAVGRGRGRGPASGEQEGAEAVEI